MTTEIKSGTSVNKSEAPQTSAEFLALVNKGDKNALAALEKARIEVLVQPDDKPLIETNSGETPVMPSSFDLKSPEFATQIASDSAGENRVKILEHALRILQGDVNLKADDAFAVTDALFGLEKNDKN